jgi:peptide chain release factor 1
LYKECGGHRIQRIPPTEKKGRVHTSTVTVAILEDKQLNFTLNETDLKCEWFSGTGSGGQHRNKTQNSCRLIHKPSGIIVTAQTRSRQSSYNECLKELESRLREMETEKLTNSISQKRKVQVGSGMRGDKIRTYRFQDDKVFDHNTGKTSFCEKVLKGNFDLLW